MGCSGYSEFFCQYATLRLFWQTFVQFRYIVSKGNISRVMEKVFTNLHVRYATHLLHSLWQLFCHPSLMK